MHYSLISVISTKISRSSSFITVIFGDSCGAKGAKDLKKTIKISVKVTRWNLQFKISKHKHLGCIMIELDFYVYNTKFHNKYGKVLFTVLTHLALNLMFRAGWSLFLNFCNKSVINLKICWLHYCWRHNAKKKCDLLSHFT